MVKSKKLMHKNIPYKKYAVACLLFLGIGLSRVLEGCVWIGEKLYHLLRYCLKTLWIAAVTAIVLSREIGRASCRERV